MALVSGGKSNLNPNAPLFIPAALRQVEDFSPEWWQLITTSTWYREYWMSEHQGQDGNEFVDEFDGNDITDLLPENFDFITGDDLSGMDFQFEDFVQSYESETLPSTVEGAENRMKNLNLAKPSSEPAKRA